jgi:hypothetical protein
MKVDGVPVKAALTKTRKMSDGNYGSFEVMAMLEVDLAKGVDLDDLFDSLDVSLTAKIAQIVKDDEIRYTDKPQPEPEKATVAAETSTVVGFGPPVVESLASEPPPPPPTESPPLPPSAPPASGPVETHETVRDCSISHQQTDTGIDYLLVKGGKWTKYGVKMWPEMVDIFIKLAWKEWKIGEAFGLPDGYTEAVVQMRPDGKPDRVVGLR